MSKVYLTAGCRINPSQYTLEVQGKLVQVRPRTFSLLMELLSHPGSLVAKETLLAKVWDDVNVDEQVLFQSIRELRQMFGGTEVIKTYPRKGYVWVEGVTITHTGQKQRSKPARKFFPASYVFAFSIAIILCVFLWQNTYKGSELANGSVIILPIKTTIQSRDHQWVYLGAMDQLISLFKSSKQVVVRSTEVVLDLMNEAGVPRDYSTTHADKIFNVTGAALVVESELSGNIEEYHLIYKLHFKRGVKQGVILAKTVDKSLQLLAQKVSQYTGQSLRHFDKKYESDFSSELMARAMEKKRQGKLLEARNLFASLLDLHANNVVARRYYAEVLTYLKEFNRANTEALKALSLSEEIHPRELPRVYYQLAEINVGMKKLDEAIVSLEMAEKYATQNNDWLYNAFTSYLFGVIYEKQKKFHQSKHAYNEALVHFGEVHCPIGRSRTRLKLAKLLSEQGETSESKKQFGEAERLMATYQLTSVQPLFDRVKKNLQY